MRDGKKYTEQENRSCIDDGIRPLYEIIFKLNGPHVLSACQTVLQQQE